MSYLNLSSSLCKKQPLNPWAHSLLPVCPFIKLAYLILPHHHSPYNSQRITNCQVLTVNSPKKKGTCSWVRQEGVGGLLATISLGYLTQTFACSSNFSSIHWVFWSREKTDSGSIAIDIDCGNSNSMAPMNFLHFVFTLSNHQSWK